MLSKHNYDPTLFKHFWQGFTHAPLRWTLPPHLVKYLAKTFGAWHVSLEILGASLEYLKDDEPAIRDYVYDSLADVYAELAEDDMFYGLWRRRCLHPETNVAIAFEQNGMWEQASNAYESAQADHEQARFRFQNPNTAFGKIIGYWPLKNFNNGKPSTILRKVKETKS